MVLSWPSHINQHVTIVSSLQNRSSLQTRKNLVTFVTHTTGNFYSNNANEFKYSSRISFYWAVTWKKQNCNGKACYQWWFACITLASSTLLLSLTANQGVSYYIQLEQPKLFDQNFAFLSSLKKNRLLPPPISHKSFYSLPPTTPFLVSSVSQQEV